MTAGRFDLHRLVRVRKRQKIARRKTMTRNEPDTATGQTSEVQIHWSATLILAVTILVSGCMTLGPDFKAPTVDIEPDWLDAADPMISDQLPAHPEWWRIFNDPVLDKLIDTARSDNLTLRSAAVRILQARAQLGIATGSKYPQVQTTTGSAAAVKLSRNATDNVPLLEDRFAAYSWDFNLTWEADLWGRYTRLIESASAQLDATVASYDGVMIALVAEVARTYVLIRTVEDQLELTRGNIRIQTESLRIADARFRFGAVTELDVEQAKTSLNNTEAQIPSLEITLRQLQNAMAVLLGRPPQDLSQLLGGPRPIPITPPEVAVGMPQDLIRRRPDIRVAEALLVAQGAQIGYAITDLYPAFFLGGTVGLSTTNIDGKDILDLFDGDSFSSKLFGGFQWNIFNYGRLKNNVRLQDAAFQQLLINYQNDVLVAQAEVDNAIISYLRSHDQARSLSIAADSAKRSVELATLQYEEGEIDFDRVLNTTNALLQQQNALAAAEGTIATSLIATYKALGGGWEVRANRAPDDLIPDATKDEMRERTKYWDGVLPVSSSPSGTSPK